MKKIIIFFIIICPYLAYSQGLYNKGARIIVQSGAQLIVKGNANGDITSTDNGSFELDGILKLEGDLTNNSNNNLFLSPDVNGEVIFSGNGGLNSQNIRNNSGFPVYMDNLTINTGSEVVIPQGNALTVYGGLLVNGSFTLESPINDNPGGSLITNSTVAGTGIINVERYFTVSNSWQQVGVPMNNQSSTLFTQNTPSGNYNANFYFYNEASNLATDPTDADYSNWNLYTDTWQSGQPGGLNNGINLTTGKGYYTYNEGNIMVNFFSVATDLNTGDKTIQVSFTDNDNDGLVGNYFDGWNFISNPFPSALDWTTLTKSANCDATVYFWDGTANNYVYFGGTPLWAIGQTEGGAVDHEIPAMQGFFIHLTASGTGDFNENFTFNNTSRTHSTQFLHKKGIPDFEYIKLQAKFADKTDETLIGYFKNAGMNFDPDYDAYKRFAFNDIPMIYSITNNCGFPLAMNALPIDSIGKPVRLGYQSSQTGLHTISIKDSEYKNRAVLLKDMYLNITTDLSQTDYTFQFNGGDVRDRFELFSDNATSIKKEISAEDFNVFPNPSDGKFTVELKMNSISNIWNLAIKDLNGKKIYESGLINKKTYIDLAGLASGKYLIELKDDHCRIIKSLIIK